MAEQLKMDLRPKRKPKYRASDQQDPDNPTYTRPNYLKMTTTPITQEYFSPSIILNQNAKLLIKFINKTNKSFKNNRLSKDELEKETYKKESLSKNKTSTESQQNTKRNTQSSKTPKSQSLKKAKDLYNFKEIHQNNELIKNLSQQQVIKGVKNLENLSGLINNKSIYSGPLSNQLSQLQSLYPNLNELNLQNFTQSPNPNLFQFNQNQSQKPVPTTQSTTNTKPPKKLKKQALQNIQKNREQKVFRRSAYHVAIAYHIYLKGLYEKGITSGDLIDPTYKARMVKEQAGMDDE